MMELEKKILIVEDDLSLRPFWSVVFDRCAPRSRLDWAVSSEQAQRLLRDATSQERPYDVIITDLFLAGSGTGLDLLESEAARRSGAKKLLVSVADAKDIQDGFLAADTAVTVLSKPLDIPGCTRVIERVLDEPKAG